ncbi:MAG: hypothetical protein QOE89_4036, partial [Pseudonocardiales bacterium]|nr:hypothetical protein [Pseudonocardiales bacterium]
DRHGPDHSDGVSDVHRYLQLRTPSSDGDATARILLRLRDCVNIHFPFCFQVKSLYRNVPRYVTGDGRLAAASTANCRLVIDPEG